MIVLWMRAERNCVRDLMPSMRQFPPKVDKAHAQGWYHQWQPRQHCLVLHKSNAIMRSTLNTRLSTTINIRFMLLSGSMDLRSVELGESGDMFVMNQQTNSSNFGLMHRRRRSADIIVYISSWPSGTSSGNRAGLDEVDMGARLGLESELCNRWVSRRSTKPACLQSLISMSSLRRQRSKQVCLIVP